MRISDWSSDVCSSDLVIVDIDVLRFFPGRLEFAHALGHQPLIERRGRWHLRALVGEQRAQEIRGRIRGQAEGQQTADMHRRTRRFHLQECGVDRSEEHTSELQSLMRISYAVFCLKKKKEHYKNTREQ